MLKIYGKCSSFLQEFAGEGKKRKGYIISKDAV